MTTSTLSPISLADLDLAAEDFRRAQDALAGRLQHLKDTQAQLRDQHLPHLRQAVIQARQARDHLAGLIEAQPDLFARPKTRTLHGIVLGLRKQPDQYRYPQDADLVRRIREQLPALAAVLIETQEKPVKQGIKSLKSEDQTRLGVTLLPGQDRIVVEPVDSEVDKLLGALLGDVLAELEPAT